MKINKSLLLAFLLFIPFCFGFTHEIKNAIKCSDCQDELVKAYTIIDSLKFQLDLVKGEAASYKDCCFGKLQKAKTK